MTTEYDDTNLGDISVDNEVIKNIALKSATEIHGIRGLSAGYARRMWDSLTRRRFARGVKLEFQSAQDVKIALRLMVEFGVSIPSVAGEVQENVKKGVEHMTGLNVTEVAISIIGMSAKKRVATPEGGPEYNLACSEKENT